MICIIALDNWMTLNTYAKALMNQLGWHCLSNATRLLRPRLFYILHVLGRVKDHQKLPHDSPLLKKPCDRQVALDKWFPLRSPWISLDPVIPGCSSVIYIYIYIMYICIYIYIYTHINIIDLHMFDWDTVASNCSTGNSLSNFDKRTSSKSSNREIWARWGFPTVSSTLPNYM